MRMPRRNDQAIFRLAAGVLVCFYYVNTLKSPSWPGRKRPDRFFRQTYMGTRTPALTRWRSWLLQHLLRKNRLGEIQFSGRRSQAFSDPDTVMFQMRITGRIYFTGGQGLSVLVSHISSFGNTTESTQLSLADAQLLLFIGCQSTTFPYWTWNCKYCLQGKTKILASTHVVQYVKCSIRKRSLIGIR